MLTSSDGILVIGRYDSRYSTTQAQIASSSVYMANYTMGPTSQAYRMNGVSSTGFTMNKGSSTSTKCAYFAIK